MFVVIAIAGVILVIVAIVLLSMRADRRRAASSHIGLPELGSLTKAAEDGEVEVRRAKAKQSESST